jgi:hypothetical protein
VSHRRVPFAHWLPVPCAPYAIGGVELNEPERIVLAVYVSRWATGSDHMALSVPQLQAETGLSERCVQKARARLETLGALEVIHRGGTGRGDTRRHRLGAEVVKGAAYAPFGPEKGGMRSTHPSHERVHGKGARKGAQNGQSLEEREKGALPEAAAPESTWPMLDLPDETPGVGDASGGCCGTGAVDFARVEEG